jgi:PAS domain S-box-containing protein
MNNENMSVYTLGAKGGEEPLRSSDIRYRRLFEASRDGILILDAGTGMVVDVNPFLIELLGYSREAFLGKKVWELGFFKVIAANEAKFAELQRKEYIYYEDMALEASDGRRIEVEFVNYLYLVNQQKVIQCNIRDITGRKRTEENVRRMATVVRDSNDAITIQDFAGRITAWNRGAELMYGYSEAEALQMSIGRLTAPGKVEEQNEFTRRLVAGEQISSFETQRVTKDGRILDVWLTVTKLIDDAGKPIGIASTERDITERRQAVEALRVVNADLEQRVCDRTAQLAVANKELEAFSYSVSHDLRAPLRHVQGFVDMLEREAEGQLSDKARRYMKTIADASREMGVLIDDLLSFSRMARTEMIETPVNLDSLVQDMVRALEPSTHDRKIAWKISPLPAVQADPSMLRLVLANLLGNAVKFTRPRETAQIEMGSAGTEDGRVILFVRDNGVGFDPQYGHKLFGVFQRLHRTEDFEGTGIGLANVRRIIARHGGRTWAEGVVDQGATFYFTLKPAAANGPTS